MKLSLSKFFKRVASCTLICASLFVAASANAYLKPASFYSSTASVLNKNNIHIIPQNLDQVFYMSPAKDVAKTPFNKMSLVLIPGGLTVEYFLGKRSGDVYGTIASYNLNYNDNIRIPYRAISQESVFQFLVLNAATLNAKDNYNVVYKQLAEIFKKGFTAYRASGFAKPVKESVDIDGYKYRVVFSSFGKFKIVQFSSFRTIFNYGEKNINFKDQAKAK